MLPRAEQISSSKTAEPVRNPTRIVRTNTGLRNRNCWRMWGSKVWDTAGAQDLSSIFQTAVWPVRCVEGKQKHQILSLAHVHENTATMPTCLWALLIVGLCRLQRKDSSVKFQYYWAEHSGTGLFFATFMKHHSKNTLIRWAFCRPLSRCCNFNTVDIELVRISAHRLLFPT